MQAQKYITLMCVGYTTLLFLLARLAGPLFVRLFTTDPELAAEAFSAIRICTLAIIPLGVQYELVDGFTGMGMPRLALPLSVFRKATYFLALFWLPGAFGVRAVFYAEPISDVLGPLLSTCVYALTIRKLLAFPGSLLLGRLDVRPVPPLRWIAGKEGCVLLFGGILLQRTAFHHGARGVIKLQMEVIDSVDP